MLNYTLDEYSVESSLFESSLDSEYRKKNGIFYTDVRLSGLILDYLAVDSKSLILDPCCGVGSFLYSAVERGCCNVYGADIDIKAVQMCRRLTGLKSTVKKIDTLFEESKAVLKKVGLKEKADCVIGNPPYCPIERAVITNNADYLFQRTIKDSGNNLFVVALYRSFDLVKDEGIVSYIIPKNFLHIFSYSSLRKYILNKKSIISIVDLGSCFSNVRGEQILITMKNSYVKDNYIKLLRYIDNSFQNVCVVKQSFYSDEILLFDNEEELNIYRKLEGTYTKFSDICGGYVGRGRSLDEDAVSGKDIRKFGFKNRPVPARGSQVFIQNIYSAEAGIIASFAGNELKAKQTVTVFTDGDEKMCRYMVGILHSRLCNFYLLKFCYNNSRLTMHTDAKYLRKLPLKKDNEVLFEQIVNLVRAIENREYMSEIWFEMIEELNELVYNMYGISTSERSYIDEEVKFLQSKRWINDRDKQEM